MSKNHELRVVRVGYTEKVLFQCGQRELAITASDHGIVVEDERGGDGRMGLTIMPESPTRIVIEPA